MSMSKEEIVSKLREYIAEGKILCKSRNGKYYHGFNRGVRKSELFKTRHKSILATDLETSEWLNELIRTDRIMESHIVGCKHRHLTTEHLIQKSCMRGEMIKFDDFGKGCVLYID